MDKEQAKIILRKVVNPDVKEAIETLIPELNESEDERIRKSLLEFLDDVWHMGKDANFDRWDKADCADWMSYLEKQKEQKSLNFSAASEWLRKHVFNYVNSEYNEFSKCVEYDGSIDKERLIRDFEKAMQKEHENNSDAHNESYLEDTISSSDNGRNLDELAREYIDGVKQYHTTPTWDLMQTAVCYGYHLREEVVSEGVDGVKPAEWSKEDEMMLVRLLDSISIGNDYEEMRNWLLSKLKSLRFQPKAELTLLDKNIIKAAVAFVEQNDHFNCWGGIDKHTVIKALYSLKPYWKPSEEQMEHLKRCFSHGKPHMPMPNQHVLESLYNDLKELM